MGAGGFEPPKLKAADLQSVPIGHSGTRPYSFLCVRSPDDLLILAWEMDFVNCFLLFSSKVFCARGRQGAAMRLALCENGGHPSFLLQKYLLDKRQIRRLRIAFCAILCYNSGRTEQENSRCLLPRCAVGRVKGKRVQIPHDLVTVIRESASGCCAHRPLEHCSGKAAPGGDLSVRKPACCWYGGLSPRSRGIGCTKKP